MTSVMTFTHTLGFYQKCKPIPKHLQEAIIGISKLKIEEGRICGECQIGKQTKMSH